ncbi:unnamed protein product [Tenebrio molitor]|nr:unnamed protein product [Tenebrio molitor]
MCLCEMSYVYLIENDLFHWRYLQLFIWGITSLLTTILFIQSGQEFENQTGDLYSAIYDIRWITFNESNKRSINIFLTMTQVPVRIKFTDLVSVNYELGMNIARNIYSFTAIFARAHNFSI